MKRRFRLTRSTDFERVRRLGRSYAHPLIVLIALSNDQGLVRIGIAVGRTVGNSVIRNRAKRVLRAALQNYLSKVTPGWDILLIARKPISKVSFEHVRTALLTLMQRAQILIKDHAG